MNKLFSSDEDRNLYIQICAKNQIEWEKSLTYTDKDGNVKPTLQALHPRSMEEAIRIATNQVEYDELHGELRYSLDDIKILTWKQIDEKRKKSNEYFKNLGNSGIMGYCKESNYNEFMKQLEERGYFHDLERTNGKLYKEKFKDFKYKHEIMNDDFSGEPFNENDQIIFVWCVQK